jgi:hypothetical protein
VPSTLSRPPGRRSPRQRCALTALLFALATGTPALAQDAEPDPVVALLQQIQASVQAGDAALFRTFAAAGVAEAPLTRFTDRWFADATTNVVLQELDRQVLGEDGRRVTVEALVEASGAGRLATWRFDIAPGPDGWRIRDASTISAIEGLFRLALDPARQYRARDLVIQSEDLELRLPDGDVFVAAVEGRATAAVLMGRGEMIFQPAPEAERRQLERFSGAEILRAEFDAVFIRFNPQESELRLPADRLSSIDVEPDDLDRAQRIFERELVKSFVVDLPGLSLDPWSLLPPSGDLVAEIETRRYDTLTYIHSSNDAEDVALFNRARRRNISVYASRARLAERGPFYDEDDRAEYDVLDYSLDVGFSPQRLFLDGQARLRIRVRAESLSSFSLRLADTLVPRAVTSNVHGRLLYLRVRNQGRLVVNLPARAERGDEFTLSVQYAGRLEPQLLDRENLQLEPERPTQPRFEPPALVVQPEPAWVYSNRSDWYPQAPVSDYGTATIRFTVPDAFSAACSGAPVSGSPVTLSDADGGARRLYVFSATSPVRYLACVVSKFPLLETRVLALPHSPPGAVTADASRDVSLHLMSASRDRNRSRETLARAERILTFYASVMRDVPYPELTLAIVESLVPGGHAPGYLVVLRQPLLTTPFVWGNDPASFEGFDDFFLAHELAHQWWGQAAGWENYHEQWLSEGFAQYFAALYAEHDRGAGTFRNILRQLTRWTRSESDQGPVYLGYRIGHLDADMRAFRAVIYNKGAIALHMLRELVGDEAFFEGLRGFYGRQRFAKAGTADLRVAMEEASGRSLAAFFEQWIFGQDLPSVDVGWTADARTLRLTIQQRGPVFQVPLPVTLVYANGTRADVTVPLHEGRAEVELPLAGRLRTVEVNRDDTIPVEVDVRAGT